MKNLASRRGFYDLLMALSHTWVWRRLIDLRSRLAAIVLTVLAVSFFAISLLIHQPQFQHYDVIITRWMQARRMTVLDEAARGFTFLGDTSTLFAVGALAMLLFVWKGRPRIAAVCLLTLVGVPLNYLIKGIWDRPRPDASLVEVLAPTIGLSFPSGHAMASTMLYGFLALVCWLNAPTPRQRFTGVAGFGATAVMISLSRVYLGAHWLSDVVGGMTAGLFLLLLIDKLYRVWDRAPVETLTPQPAPTS